MTPADMKILEARGKQADAIGRACANAADLLQRLAKANVIFPSMCANNMEAWNLSQELQQFISGEPK